jgi:hypothetical protein
MGDVGSPPRTEVVQREKKLHNRVEEAVVRSNLSKTYAHRGRLMGGKFKTVFCHCRVMRRVFKRMARIGGMRISTRCLAVSS